VTIILGDDSLNKTFFPKRTRCQNLFFSIIQEDYFLGRRNVGFDNHLETSSSTLIAPDTLQVNNNPHTSMSHINTIQNHQTQNSDEDALQEEIVEIKKFIWRNPTRKTTIALDIDTLNEPTITNQLKFNASSLYKMQFQPLF
jgi:hypothetical protein